MLAVIVALPMALVWITVPFIALQFGVERVARYTFLPKRVLRLAERFAEHNLRPRDLLAPMCFSIGVNVTGMGMMLASLHAVGQDPSVTSVLLIRLVAQIAAHAVPVMQGAGVVEFSMVSALQQLGVHASTAAAATVLFRAAQFWLPLMLGVMLFASLPRLKALFAIRSLPRLGELRIWWSASFGRVS
jgi:phosphatidylglycerol lysyltransferase